MRPTVLLLAGEPSGDQHGAALAGELRARRPDVRFVGTGGPTMHREGVELLAGLDDLAVMGVTEVLPRLPFFRALERRVRNLVDAPGTRLVIPIDYPGFNMRIARYANRRRVKVLYYVAPKVWAWRPGRAAELARTTDRVAAILPFEVEGLRAAGVSAEYVGHPLLDRPDDVAAEGDFRVRWGLDDGRPLLALLPGSREQEIGRHLELFVQAARRVCAALPEVLPVLSRASTVDPMPFRSTGLAVVEDTRALLRHATVALVKSGTATLEAALADTPSVVAYRTSRPTWWAAKAFLRTEHVALPNLVARASVVPEYLQERATPDALAKALVPLFDLDGPERRLQLDGFERVRDALGGPGTSARVAGMAAELMEEGD